MDNDSLSYLYTGDTDFDSGKKHAAKSARRSAYGRRKGNLREKRNLDK